MTDEKEIRRQFALAIVDTIWLAGKITDEERIRAKQIIPRKLEVIYREEEKAHEKVQKIGSSPVVPS